MIRFKTFATEREAGLFAAAIDAKLGYPRDLDPSEYTRGPGRHSATPPHTETHSGVLALADGTFAVEVDEVVEAMHGAEVDIDVGAGKQTVTIDTSGAKEVDRDTATGRPARGGLTLRKVAIE